MAYRYKKRPSYSRRKSSYRKKSYNRNKKTVGYKLNKSDNDAYKQAQIYRYPFSNQTTIPKIPDGLAQHSVGVSFNHVHALAGLSPNCTIILFPGMNNWLHTVNNDASTSNAGHTLLNYFLSRAGTEPNYTYQIFQGQPGTNDFTGTESFDYEKWRLVSAGLRIKCINNDQENEGHWEAIRIPMTDHRGRMPVVAAGGNRGQVRPANPLINVATAHTSYQINSTYQMGKIKDLGKYEARLKPMTNNHVFKSMVKAQGAVLTDFATNMYPADGMEFHNDLTDSFIDDNWDAIAIRIHGVANTRIILQSRANYELIPRVNTPISSFASENAYAPKLIESKFLEYKRKETKPMAYIYSKK